MAEQGKKKRGKHCYDLEAQTAHLQKFKATTKSLSKAHSCIDLWVVRMLRHISSSRCENPVECAKVALFTAEFFDNDDEDMDSDAWWGHTEESRRLVMKQRFEQHKKEHPEDVFRAGSDLNIMPDTDDPDKPN